MPVLAIVSKTADVPVYFDGVGTGRALNTVTVRPQVDGKLINISFIEGQDVKKGFVLAKIDPVTYQAAYDQTVAKKAQDEAQLANAKLDLDRYTRLAATNAVNKQQLDTQKAMVAQLEAQVRLDQAAIDNARAILSYTDIIAPITGRTGIRQVDEGNIVHASDSTGIVILTQLRPISIFFSLPQQNLPELNKGQGEAALSVEALAADGKTVLDRGKVVVIDNQVDQTTGTVKLKGEFPNTDLQLWPGQFVNVRVLIDTLRQVVVVPTAAIQRGPSGPFVYVLKDDSTVAVRRIGIRLQNDRQTVIAQGLQAGERVDHQRLRPADGRYAGGGVDCRRFGPGQFGAPRQLEPGQFERGFPAAAVGAAPGSNGRKAWRRKGQARRARCQSMSVSSPFIHRPIATSLLGVAVMLGGVLGYLWLPVSSLPQVDFPTIQVTTQLPGAGPDVMASLVTAPLERNFGQIPSLVLMTSSSSFGVSQVTLQFDLNRDIDAAAQDVQAAINASGSTLPKQSSLSAGLFQGKSRRRADGDAGDHVGNDRVRQLSDIADTLLAQRLERAYRRRPGYSPGQHQAGNPNSG